MSSLHARHTIALQPVQRLVVVMQSSWRPSLGRGARNLGASQAKKRPMIQLRSNKQLKQLSEVDDDS